MILFAEGFSVTEMGLTAFCLLCVIKMMFDFFGKNKPKENNNEVARLAIKGVQDKLDTMATAESNFRRDVYVGIGQTKDLYDWHNVNDGDGRKIWYVKASLENSIKELCNIQKENTNYLKELITTIKGLDN